MDAPQAKDIPPKGISDENLKKGWLLRLQIWKRDLEQETNSCNSFALWDAEYKRRELDK